MLSLAARVALYEAAEITVDVDDLEPDAIAARIAALL